VRATRWESFLANFVAVFSESDEAFSGWLKRRRLMIGDDMKVYRDTSDRIGVTLQHSPEQKP
jgi:hypothetical protein